MILRPVRPVSAIGPPFTNDPVGLMWNLMGGSRFTSDFGRIGITTFSMMKRDPPIKFHINPTGSFVKGGPMADTGLPGRKIIVDTYGGVGSHGGGALSGKDPSKVDRSASYGARYVAKNLVASGLCDRCEVQIAYAIGVPKPVSIMVDSKCTGKVSDEKLTSLVRKHFDLTPHGLIKHFRLRRPIYRATAAYGHFGRDEPAFTWERTDKARLLARSV